MVIKTTKSTSFALSPESLKLAISSDVEVGLMPLFLCVIVGTIATTAVDPLDSLRQVAKYYGIWVHVDAAYAGSACICPEFRHFIDGVVGASSFSLNEHKWLFTALDCCCVWIKDPSTLTSSLSTNPEYLRNKATDSKQVVDYKDWQMALSRRFRAMKLWLVLKSYGAINLKNYLRSHVKMATLFEGLVSTDRRFEVGVPRVFSMVCFRVSPSAAIIISDDEINVENRINEVNRRLLEGINASGHAFMTHAVVGGMYVIRCAIGVILTEEKHIAMAWKLVQEHADAILMKNNT